MPSRPPLRPNVSGPWFQPDQRTQDVRSTVQLYNKVKTKFDASIWCKPETFNGLVDYILEAVKPPRYIHDAFRKCIREMLKLETVVFSFPYDVDLRSQTLPQQIALRRFLRAKKHFLDHSDRAADVLGNSLISIFGEIARHLPKTDTANAALAVAMVDIHKDLNGTINHILGVGAQLAEEDVAVCLQLSNTLYTNLCRISKIDPDDMKPKKPPVFAGEYKGDPLDYLDSIPIRRLFEMRVPFHIPNVIKFAHTWVVAGSGHGKTTAMTAMISEHLAEVLKGNASVVVIDSQSSVIPQFERLKMWEGSDRLIVVHPNDPVAFSLFDYPPDQLNTALEMINFIFAKLSADDMTYRQDNMFAYLSEFLITAVPNATLHDFRDLLDPRRASKYDKYLPMASPEVQDYFATDFTKEKYTVNARGQVLTKLRGMLREPAFARMFGAPKTKLNLFRELERGVCCLISPDKSKLGEDGTRLFGRFWIAQMKLVAQQRQEVNAKRKTPTFFFIDEAQDYLRGGDPKVESILEQARKQHIGLALLHHYADQLRSNDLVQLLGANTATKICGSLGSADLTRFASLLQCEPSFIQAQQPRESFACAVSGLTNGAISLQFPFIDLEREPVMSEAAYQAMRRANADRYGAGEKATVAPDTPEPAAVKKTSLRDLDLPLPPDDDMTSPGEGGWKK